MDGHFVPNLTIGPPVVACLRPHTSLYLDCHLMISNPGDLIDDFAKAGADGITVHVELGDPRPLFDQIRKHNVAVGLTLNPDTPIDAVLPYLDEIDTLLFMSVFPGFGGQAFIPAVLDKVRAARAEADARNLMIDFEIDGGISAHNARDAVDAGCNVLVAGSAIFGASDPVQAIASIRAAATNDN